MLPCPEWFLNFSLRRKLSQSAVISQNLGGGGGGAAGGVMRGALVVPN
jgi:hypothetical protein